MSDEASPRPWRVDDSTAHERFGRKFVRIRDANGQSITVEGKGRLFAEDAALIVDAVNERAKFEAAHMEFPDFRPVIIAAGQRDAAIAERDRLRDIVKRFVLLFEPNTIHPEGTSDRLLREARAAIGEDAP